MSKQVWENHLLDRINDLERRLAVAQNTALKQHKRAELWRLRALQRTAFHSRSTTARRL